MKKNIIIILLAGFILSSFFRVVPQAEPGEYSGALYFYISEKPAPDQGMRISIDSVRGSATIDLTSSDIVQAMKGQPGAIRPIKFFLVPTGSQGRKVIPFSYPKSMILYDFSVEEHEETVAFIKKSMRLNPKDTIKTEFISPTMFGNAEMFYQLIRNQ